MAALAESKYWRRADAEIALEAWAVSGRSLTDFARQWGLNDRRLRRWARRLSPEALAGDDGAAILPAFRQVEVLVEEPAAPHDSGVELLLPGGCRVAVQRGFDPRVLQELLRALGAAAC